MVEPPAMMGARARKLTWRVLVVYALGLLLVGFADPDPRKVGRWWFWVGLALLAAGQAVRLWAAGHLRKNEVLTVTGPYAYVKNPLYLGTFWAMVGFALVAKSDPTLPAWYLRHLNLILLAATISVFVLYYVPYKRRREGSRLHGRFGCDWEHYDHHVPDYLPRWRRYERAGSRRWSWSAVRENSELWTPLALAGAVVAVVFNGSLLTTAARLWP